MDDETLTGLRRAFASGRTRSEEWRLAQLARLADLLHEREPELREALAADLGRCPVEAWFELGMIDRQLRHVRHHLRRWMRPVRYPPYDEVKLSWLRRLM